LKTIIKKNLLFLKEKKKILSRKLPNQIFETLLHSQYAVVPRLQDHSNQWPPFSIRPDLRRTEIVKYNQIVPLKEKPPSYKVAFSLQVSDALR
jgi:hypothetical protein